jgi:hypothetical protein
MPARDFHVHVDPDDLRLAELSATPPAERRRSATPGRPARPDDSGRGRPVRTAAAGQSRRYAFRRS